MPAVSPADNCNPQSAHEKQFTWKIRSRARITKSLELMPAPQRAQRRTEKILWMKLYSYLECPWDFIVVCLSRSKWKMSPAIPQKIVHRSRFFSQKSNYFFFIVSHRFVVFTDNYDSVYSRAIEGPKIATEAKIKVNRSRHPSNKATVITFYDQFIWWSFFQSPPSPLPFNCFYLHSTLCFLQSPATFESTHKSYYCFTKRDARRTYELSMSSMSFWMFDWFKVLSGFILLIIFQSFI